MHKTSRWLFPRFNVLIVVSLLLLFVPVQGQAAPAQETRSISLDAIETLSALPLPAWWPAMAGKGKAQGRPSSALVDQAADVSHPFASAQATAALQGSSMMFIENVGQFADDARFQVHGSGRTIWLAEDALWVTVMEPSSLTLDSSPYEGKESAWLTLPHLDRERGLEREDEPRRGVNLKLSFAGANPHPRIEPFDRLDTHVSYFTGNNPERWRADVPVWGGVRYVDLYPGVDLEVTDEEGRWTWRLVIRDPQFAVPDVRLRVEGVDGLALDDAGHLRITTAVDDFALPLLQTVAADGTSIELVTAQPEINGVEITSPFAPSPRPTKRGMRAQISPIVPSAVEGQDISSDLLYSTFLGGGSDDRGLAIAVDEAGNSYVTGDTWSSNFPTTPGAFDTDYNGGYRDAFVVKLNADGTGLAYATFLGGEFTDYGYSIAVDGAGSAYVTGDTSSRDFPTTPGAFETNHSPMYFDAFMVKLNADGTGLAYSTFLVGMVMECGYAIAVDGAGSAYVTGVTESSDFPTTAGAFDTSFNSGWDAFVVKLSPAGNGGSDLLYGTFLGGSSDDKGLGIAVDEAGNAYVTGDTWSSDFPTTPGAFDTDHNGGYRDAFVVKLNADGTGLVYGTFLGGSSDDRGYGIAVDGAGSAYVTGYTDSSNFPTTLGAFDTDYNGGYRDAFVVKLNADGAGLVYGTFLGGSSYDYGYDIAVDGADSAYVTGYTDSSDFPTTLEAFDTSHNGGYDAFVVKLNADGAGLVYGTFLGGSSDDRGYGIAVDGAGSAYMSGYTDSSDFPTTPGAFDTTYNGGGDAFVAKLNIGGSDVVLRVLDESGEPLLWNRLVTETLRIEAQVLEGEHPDVMTATVQTFNSELTATVALERVGTLDIYQGAVPVGQIVDRMVTDTAAAVLYVRDNYTQEEIEREYGVAADFLAALGPESAWRGIAQGDGDEEQFIPPANLEFMRAAGYEVITATLQGAEDVTARAFVHNQAEVLLYIGHGWHDRNFLHLNGGDDESSEGNATPESLMDGDWAEGLDKVILMGCSVLDVNDYNDWRTGTSHDVSPGKEWAEIPGPAQLLGFQANAPRINEDQGDRCVELWSLYYIDASPYWCPEEPYGVCAWRLATGMNIAPLTRFPTAVAIDADSYYYWKVWFQIPIPEHEIDLVTWQPVTRDEWDLNTEGLEALMASPVDLHFYDRYGNHLGPDGSGGFDTQIPGSSYEIPEGTDYKVAFVKNADLSDEYDVRLVGTGAGTFDFNLLIPERSAGVKYDVAYVDVPVVTGTLGTIDLQPGTGFTLSLDLDGDGQFDQQLAPTAMQTRTLPYIFADDFDRADSTDLGPNWVEEAGDWDIVDGRLHAQANGEQGVGATESFSDTRYVVETRFRATGSLLGPYNAFALGFGAADVGGDPTGYSVTYVPAWGKLKLTREYTFLDHSSVTLVPGQWYQFKVVRDGDTGLIQVYLDEGQGYPETPTLEAVDSTYPDLRRLGWAVLGSGYDLYVDWIVVQ